MVLVALGAAAAPVATGTTLQPTEDGMSVPGMMMAKMEKMHKDHMNPHREGRHEDEHHKGGTYGSYVSPLLAFLSCWLSHFPCTVPTINSCLTRSYVRSKFVNFDLLSLAFQGIHHLLALQSKESDFQAAGCSCC